MTLQSDADLRQLLQETKTIAVVGWSNRPDRPSNEVAAYLKAAGYDIYPVNPILKSTPEQTVYGSLAEVPVKIDVVDIFRRAEDVPEVVAEAIKVGAKAVWIQLGIINESAAAEAESAGLKAVMDRCMKIEHQRLVSQVVHS
ncbi:MAG: CoA-binding protein [Anaerolinea sp.]|nr:CoA-binding protein [Anaerolinea sp.]